MPMKTHPVANLFPMLPAGELRELADSIAKEGLLTPCVRQKDILLDGRNRIAACKLAGVEPRFVEYEGDSPVACIIGANLARRHLDKGQKIALAIEIEPHFAKEARKRRGGDRRSEQYQGGKSPTLIEPAKSRDLAAKSVGVSGKQVTKAKAVKEYDKEHGTDFFKQVTQGHISVAKAVKQVKAEQDRRDLAAAQETISTEKRKSIESVCDLRVCSCAELFASGIRPDAVITDPPYPAEFLPVFTELAKGCKSAGVPLVAVMSGQSYLPDVMRRLCEHLKYRWTLAYMTPGASCRIWPSKIDCQWKPVLLFGDASDLVFDVFRSDAIDKRFHDWGQSNSGMLDLVERLTKPGQLVCDPFCGGGATAVAAMRLGRRFVGCDVDEKSIAVTKSRVLSMK